MRLLQAILNWIRQLFRSNKFERDMQDEMRSHIEQQAEIYTARGMNPRDAMIEARRDFGNVPLLQEQSRDARGTRFIEETKRDFYYGLRALLRTPGFTLVAVLSLTLGIGVNTAMFTLMRFVLAPAHVTNPETLVQYKVAINHRMFLALTAERNLFAQSVVYSTDNVALPRDGKSPIEVSVQLVSGGYFAVYETRALLGRLLVEGEMQNAGGVPTTVISYRFWQNEFGSDSSIIGKSIRLTNGSTFQIVGVTPPDYIGAHKSAPDLWLPLSSRVTLPARTYFGDPADKLTEEDVRFLFFSARLSPGVTFAQARLKFGSVLARTSDDMGRVDQLSRDLESGVDSGVNLKNAAAVTLIFATTIVVLLIGCANVANLVMARGVRRRREIAVRLSLGASRIRLIRQLMTENAIIAVTGATLALAFSTATLRFVANSELMQTSLHSSASTIMRYLRPDLSIVLFTFAVALVSATASGLIPALQSTKLDLSRATRDDGTALGNRLSRSPVRTMLVVGQIALSMVLLISASVLLQSARNVFSMEVGFDREHVTSVALPASQGSSVESHLAEFGKSFEQRVSALLGSENVARGTLPMHSLFTFQVNPSNAKHQQTSTLLASANYFEVLGIPLLVGRTFSEYEAKNASPVVVISESGANKLWPHENPLGKTITLESKTYARITKAPADRWDVTVIGVAKDAQVTQLDYVPGMLIYMPADTGSFLLRVSDPRQSAAMLRDAARVTDANVLVDIKTADELIVGRGPAQGVGVVATGATGLGIAALMLSVMGIFGVVAYAVSQRTREIGVRLALGAQKQDVLQMVIRQGMRPVLFGATAGIVLALLFTRALSVFLFGVEPFDSTAYVIAVSLVAAAAVLACYFPARRAMTVDPVGALRAD